MAGAGFKTFTTGEVLLAADVNQYLMQQTVMVFDDATARTTALPTPSEGMFSYLKDTNLSYRYDGSAWISDVGTTSPLTTKGDVWGYSTADARIPVGANGTVLTADSAEALGVKWAAVSTSPTFVGCLVYRTSAQALTQNVGTISNFPAESFDTDGFHDNTTNNSRITIPAGKAGYYLLIAGQLDIETSGSANFTFMKNGGVADPTGQYTFNSALNTGGNTIRLVGSLIVSANVGDYFQVGLLTDGTGKNSNRAVFGCTYLGA